MLEVRKRSNYTDNRRIGVGVHSVATHPRLSGGNSDGDARGRPMNSYLELTSPHEP